MLRALLGFRTDNRSSECPEVLYIGHQESELNAAVAAAPADFIRLERADLHVTRRCRKSAPVADAPPATQVAETPADSGRSESAASGEAALEEHTIDELRALAAREKIDLTGRHRKDEILEAIEEARTPLAERTIPQLRALAAERAVDLTGLSTKADIVAALELAETIGPDSLD